MRLNGNTLNCLCSFVEKLLLDLHNEKSLHFDTTHHLLCADKITPLNKARNYQEVDSDTGQSLCTLIDQQYDKILKEIDEKKRQQEARMPAPFLQVHAAEESQDASGNGSVQSHAQVGVLYMYINKLGWGLDYLRVFTLQN